MLSVLFWIVLAGVVGYLVKSSVQVIQQSTVGIVERIGKFHKTADVGLNFIVPFLDRIRTVVDLREQVIDFPPQPVITADNVTMNIDTVVYMQVTDPFKFVYEISNPRAAIENLTNTSLRNLIGELALDETLTSRETINSKLQIILDEATNKWGIKINRVELKSIDPPTEIKQAMEKQMRAEREKRAAILQAEGEKQSNILKAEGEKESAILRAQGERESYILKAEGEANAIRIVADAKALANKVVFEAIKAAGPTREVVAIRAMEALEKVSESDSSKLIVPTEALGLMGALTAGKQAWKE